MAFKQVYVEKDVYPKVVLERQVYLQKEPRIILKRLSLSLTHPYRCTECKQRFQKSYEATAHYLTTHENSNDLPENNEKWNKSKNSKNPKNSKNCKKNMKRKDAGIKKCPVCKETFEFRFFLIKHVRSTHEDFRIYDCSHCDKNFLSLQGQMNHKFHSHERKMNELGCTFCGKDFWSKDELKNHKLTKHKENKYQCFKCEASYLSEITLQNHIEHVHEGKKFKCTTCVQSFESICRLDTHIAVKYDRTSNVHIVMLRIQIKENMKLTLLILMKKHLDIPVLIVGKTFNLKLH